VEAMGVKAALLPRRQNPKQRFLHKKYLNLPMNIKQELRKAFSEKAYFQKILNTNL